jgi:pilus assembly protein Flp/PilA
MRKTVLARIRQILKDESGPTAVEYAIMLAFIAGVCIASVQLLTASVDDSFSTSSTTIANAVGN